MSNGFCYFAQRRSGDLLSDLSRSLRLIGARLANPGNGVITRLTDDGDQVSVSEQELADRVSKESSVTFQFWFTEGTDLRCSYRDLSNGVCVHAYGLDGLDRAEKDSVRSWAVNYFRSNALRRTALLMVIDPVGVTAGFDWDSFVRGDARLPASLPEVIGVQTESVSQNWDSLRGHSCESIDGYRLFSSNGGT